MNDALINTRIKKIDPLPNPRELKGILPILTENKVCVLESRKIISDIIHHRDRRLLAVVGPCSLHNKDEAIEYAHKLLRLHHELKDHLYIIMRAYFEKPRTRLGWRGMIIDPHLDGSYDIALGLHNARSLLLAITSFALPVGSEFLDPIVPQYIGDLVSWASIGARTTESQIHRDMASGLSLPVGFKNATNGDKQVAINAMLSSQAAKSFLGIDQRGITSVFRTKGNKDIHLVLRGGDSGPNYSVQDVRDAHMLLKENTLPPSIIIDCSHGNSQKNYHRQQEVLHSLLKQYCETPLHISGFMLESNLSEGRQDISKSTLLPGVSLTDACIGWEDTQKLLYGAAERIARGVKQC